jgi:methyl-accepting chemotaxis protein
VVAEIQQVSSLMAQISSAAREQHIAIEAIDGAVVQLDDATQQNAALVEEAAAAAQSLQEQATALTETVAVFKLGEADSGTQRIGAGGKRALLAYS